MALVVGSLRDAALSAASLGQPRVVFYFPDPQLSAGIAAGRVTPTQPVYAIPDGEGSFSIDLITTDSMIDPNAHYKMRVEWVGDDGTIHHMIDYPDWEIRVTDAGGTLDDLARYGHGTFWNQRIVWVGLTQPLFARRGMLWLLSDPNNPDNITTDPSWDPSWEIGDLLEWE